MKYQGQNVKDKILSCKYKKKKKQKKKMAGVLLLDTEGLALRQSEE